MVHGAFNVGTEITGFRHRRPGQLTCIPAIAGTVCDLSAQVGVPVTDVASSPPVPPVGSDAVVLLPRTGASHINEMLAIGFGAILLGGALLLGRRRIGVR